ncbi:MAG TPA: hypothetical protein VHF58_01520 [Solirubrobacterales bacterium]|nr:hypothetical protein [Solirubrobacterales bacterium]
MPISRGAFKRSLLGYRPSEVEAALAAHEATIAQRDESLDSAVAELEAARRRIAELQLVAERLSDRVVAREGELRDAQAELDRLRADGEDRLRSLTALARELEAVRSQARGQATRIRMLALREAAELSERVAALVRSGEERPERIMDAAAAALAAEASAMEPSGNGSGSAQPPSMNGHTAPPRVAEDVFVGSVEVEVGPLSDFSQLVGFEDAAGAIDATREISVTRFAQGRATLAMQFGEPVELLRELEERAPFEFKVRDLRADRVVLDIDDE